MWGLISSGGRKAGSELQILSSLEVELTGFGICIVCTYTSYKYPEFSFLKPR